jgi:hypothetical protein
VADVPKKPIAVRRRGRAVGTAVFAAVITSFTAVCSVQIIMQAWAPPVDSGEVDCHRDVQALIGAVRRAREAAIQAASGEREAVSRFRSALEPEWSHRPAVGEKCQNDPETVRTLEEVDRLRYGEEHALRYEALDIASLRRQVVAAEKRLEGAAPSAPAP